MKKKKPAELLKKRSTATRDKRIDKSDIPDLSNTKGWLRGLMYRPLLRPISIRLPAPDLAAAQKQGRKKGLPYQTYIKQLLHDALARETRL